MTTPTHTLTRHKDIQNWVAGRKGLPAIRRIPDQLGVMRSRLCLSFAHKTLPNETPITGDGMTPVSWTAWLAELDRQHLALRVSQDEDFEFVERKELN